MTERIVRPIVLVGYSAPWQKALVAHDPDGRFLFVEEPDVVRKREVGSHLDAAGIAFELIPWEYHLPAAADRFYLAHPRLAPAAIVPVVEYAVPFAARLSERYGVPGAGLGAAQLLRNKHLLRQASAEAGVINPQSLPVSGPDEVRAFMRRSGRTAILKPANRQASVGTCVIERLTDVEAVWAQCIDQDEGVVVPDRPMPLQMLVEEYVDGEEFSVEMLVRDGEPQFANVTQKLLFPGVRPVEMGHTVPADLPRHRAELLRVHTRRVLDAVGFGTGYVHCEWIIARGLPHLVECAGRMPGDFIVPLIDRAWGIDSLALFLSLMRGEPLPAIPLEARAGAAIRYFEAAPGTVVNVTGVEEARQVAGVLDVEVRVKPDDYVSEVSSSWDRAGFVMVEAANPGTAMQLAAESAARVRVEVAGQDAALEAA